MRRRLLTRRVGPSSLSSSSSSSGEADGMIKYSSSTDGCLFLVLFEIHRRNPLACSRTR